MTDPKKDAWEPTDNKLGPSKQSREAERQRVVEESWTCEKSLKSSASFSTKGRLLPATEARGWNDIRGV
jgi:hypothetical protein